MLHCSRLMQSGPHHACFLNYVLSAIASKVLNVSHMIVIRNCNSESRMGLGPDVKDSCKCSLSCAAA